MTYHGEGEPHLHDVEQILVRADTEGAQKDQVIAAQEDEIADLKQQLEGTNPPAPTGRKVLYGSSNQTSKGTWNELIGHVGHDLMIHRTYDPEPDVFDRSAMREDAGKRACATSFKLGGGTGFTEWPNAIKGAWDDEVKARWNSIPLTQDVWDTPWHECDGGHAKEDGRPGEYIGMFNRFYGLLKPINASRVSRGGIPIKLGPIIMGETVTDLDANNWMPDAMDFFGVDFYSQKTPPTQFKDRAPVYERFAATLSVPLCIGETGCPQVDPNQGADNFTSAQKKAMRAEWVRNMWQYVANNKAKYGYVCYWNSSNNFMTTQPEWDALGSYPTA